MTQFFEQAAVLVVIRLVVVAAVYFFVLAVTNIVWMRLNCRPPRRGSAAMVSVLIPARNEEHNIGRCLDSLVAQTHANYEILVLDGGRITAQGPRDEVLRSMVKNAADVQQAISRKTTS